MIENLTICVLILLFVICIMFTFGFLISGDKKNEYGKSVLCLLLSLLPLIGMILLTSQCTDEVIISLALTAFGGTWVCLGIIILKSIIEMKLATRTK